MIALACALAVNAARHFAQAPETPSQSKRALARSKGDPKNPFWVVEYLDFQCGTCRDGAALLSRAAAAHPDDLYLQVRFFPLIRTHRFALKASVYAECASRQGKFWPFHDALFESQEEWSASSAPPDQFFEKYAAAAGLDGAKLGACVSDPSVKAAVIAEKDHGLSLGIRITPTYFVNGKRVTGVVPLSEELAARYGGEDAL